MLPVTLLDFYTLRLSQKPEEIGLSVVCVFIQMDLPDKNTTKES